MISTKTFRLAAVAGLLAVIPAQQPFAYTPYTWKWPTRQVPYYINPTNLDVPVTSAIAALQSAAAAWTAQSNTSFSFYYAGPTTGTTSGNNGKNEVFFRNTSNGTAIATTYSWFSGSQTLDTDIVFWDGAYKFFTGTSGCSGGFYVEDVGTHEFGHALGLSHSSVSDATMVSGQAWCSTYKRSLAADDILAVETLYPPTGVNQAPKVTIVSPLSGASLAAGSLVTFSASAQDAEDGDLSTRVVWASTIDGQLGTGATIQKALTAGTHTIRATVSDSAGATIYNQIAVSVSSGTVLPPASGVVLSATPRKVKGFQQVDLRWTSSSWSAVDLYRNGVKVLQTVNDGSHLDVLNLKGGGSYTYRVCGTGTTACSNSVTVTF